MVKFDTSITKPLYEKWQIGKTFPECSESTTNDFYNIFWKSFQFLARLSALRKLYKKLQNETEFDKKLGILEKKDQLLKEKPLKVTGLTVLYSNTSVLITANQLSSFKATLLSRTVPTGLKDKISQRTKERGFNKILTEKQKEEKKTQVIKQESKELEVPVEKSGHSTSSKKKYERINRRQISKLRLEFPDIAGIPKKISKEGLQFSEPIPEVVLPKPKDVTVEKAREEGVQQEEAKRTVVRTPKNKRRLSSSDTVKKPSSFKRRKRKRPYGYKFTSGGEADLKMSSTKTKVKRSPQIKSMTSLNSGESSYSSLYQHMPSINVSEFSLNVMDISPETMVRFAMAIKEQSGDKWQGENTQSESSENSTKDFYNIYWKSFQFLKRLRILQKVYKNVQSEIQPDKKIDILEAKDKLLKETPLKVMGLRVFCSSTSVVITEDQLPPFKEALLSLKEKFPQDKNPEEKQNGESKETEETVSQETGQKSKESKTPIATPSHTTPSKRKYEKYKRKNLSKLKLEFHDWPNTFKILPREEERRKLSEPSLEVILDPEEHAVKQVNDFGRRKETPTYVDKFPKFDTSIKKKISRFESTQPESKEKAAKKQKHFERRKEKRPHDDKFENFGTPIKKNMGKLEITQPESSEDVKEQNDIEERQGRRLYDDKFADVDMPVKKKIEKFSNTQLSSIGKTGKKKIQGRRLYNDKFADIGPPVKKKPEKFESTQPAFTEKAGQKKRQGRQLYDDKFADIGTPVKKKIDKFSSIQPASTKKAGKKKRQGRQLYDDKFADIGRPVKKKPEKFESTQPASTEKAGKKKRQGRQLYDDKFADIGTPVNKKIGKFESTQPSSTEKVGKKKIQGRRLYDDKFADISTPVKKKPEKFESTQPASTEKAGKKKRQGSQLYDDKFADIGTPVNKQIGKFKSTQPSSTEKVGKKKIQGRRLYDDKFADIGTPVKKKPEKFESTQPASTEKAINEQSDFEERKRKRPYDDRITPPTSGADLKMPPPKTSTKAKMEGTTKVSEIKLKTTEEDDIKKTAEKALPGNFSVHNLIRFFDKQKKPED